jgi:hypothetical protein
MDDPIRFITFILIGAHAEDCAWEMLGSLERVAFALQNLAPAHVHTVRILTPDEPLDRFQIIAADMLKKWDVAVRQDDFLMYGVPEFT